MADQLLNGIIINEILVDPNGAVSFDTDGNGTSAATDEYIELYNSSNSAINISGLQLWDDGVGNWFTFPAGTILQAGGHAMVMTGLQPGGSLPTGAPNDLFFSAGRNTALINNTGDNVTLYDPTNNQYIQATFNGDPLDTPTNGSGGYSGFSSTATRVGAGENFGYDVDGLSLQRETDGADTINLNTPTPGVTNVCFADGTFLATPSGNTPIEQLRAGDLVETADRGPQPITWAYSHTWTAAEIARSPNLAAVLIRAGALGVGLPSKDLRLSQQHRVLIKGAIAQRMFGASEVLVPAKSLLTLPGVSLDFPETDVTYFHIMLDQHEVVFSNGVPSESLFLGAQAIEAIPARALNEICAVLNVARCQLGKLAGPVSPARTFVKGKKAAQLIERHAKNGHSFFGEHPNLSSSRPQKCAHLIT